LVLAAALCWAVSQVPKLVPVPVVFGRRVQAFYLAHWPVAKLVALWTKPTWRMHNVQQPVLTLHQSVKRSVGITRTPVTTERSPQHVQVLITVAAFAVNTHRQFMSVANNNPVMAQLANNLMEAGKSSTKSMI